MNEKVILFFDGVCNLCNESVKYVIRHDKRQKIKFAPLQSDFSTQILKQFRLKEKDLDSVILLRGDKIYTQSGAVLELMLLLGGWWKLLYVFKIVPAPIRNSIYNWIAKNRYKWYGKQESCLMPTPELKDRFLG